MEPKPWWQSKTLWANAAALIAAVGMYVQSKDTTALGVAALSIVNMIFRIVTKQPLDV